jgi:hypothetical protein
VYHLKSYVKGDNYNTCKTASINNLGDDILLSDLTVDTSRCAMRGAAAKKTV